MSNPTPVRSDRESMAHLCQDCDRSFVEERLLKGHLSLVHADKAVDGTSAPAEGSTAEEATETPAQESEEDDPHSFAGGIGEVYAICNICGHGPYHAIHNARLRDQNRNGKKADVASLKDFLDSAVQVRPGSVAQNTANDVAPAYLRSIYAVDTSPERRRVVKISGDPGDYKTEVVSDYNTLYGIGTEIRQMADVMVGVKQVGKPMDEMADADDSPEAQQYLMAAWQAVVMYMTSVDDKDDQAAAMQVLKMITGMMTDSDEPNQPATTGAFNVTAMARLDRAANTFDCPQCKRNFSTEAGLIGHLKTIHAQREKETKAKTESD